MRLPIVPRRTMPMLSKSRSRFRWRSSRRWSERARAGRVLIVGLFVDLFVDLFILGVYILGNERARAKPDSLGSSDQSRAAAPVVSAPASAQSCESPTAC